MTPPRPTDDGVIRGGEGAGAGLILLPDADQPFAPLVLAHLSEQAFPLADPLGDGFFLGRATDPDLDLARLEIRRADRGEGLDGELDDGGAVELSVGGLLFPAFFQLA